MNTKIKSLLALALCAVGLSAFAKEPDAVQLWEGGPYFATCNIGAEKPEDYGILTNFNDAAQAVTGALGEGWRVPTAEEFTNLVNNCDYSWTTDYNGTSATGRVFTSKSDSSKSIFFPAAGYDYGQGCIGDGSKGYYWSSTEVDGSRAWYLYLSKSAGGATVENKLSRSYLASVRAVRDTPPPPALAVANVTTATHWPWDGKIDVTCDLTGAGKVQLSAALTTNGVTVCTAKAENITGEIEIDLDQVGGVTNGVKFVWDAKADCPAGFNSTGTKVKVSLIAVKASSETEYVVMKMGTGEGAYTLKWATMNLGAEKVTDCGDYFAWGETAPYYEGTGGWPTTPTWKSGKESGYAWQSYCGKSSFSEWSTPPYDATTKILKPEFDAAAQILGDGWRMPTSAEFKALYDACLNGSYDKTTNPSGASASVGKGVYWCTNYDGVAGCLFCDGTNKLFFPAAGLGSGTSLNDAGSFGYYWSSSHCTDFKGNAYNLFFYSVSVSPQFDGNRNFGFSVRPVKEVK